jgi:hypothetical protein
LEIDETKGTAAKGGGANDGLVIGSYYTII